MRKMNRRMLLGAGLAGAVGAPFAALKSTAAQDDPVWRLMADEARKRLANIKRRGVTGEDIRDGSRHIRLMLAHGADIEGQFQRTLAAQIGRQGEGFYTRDFGAEVRAMLKGEGFDLPVGEPTDANSVRAFVRNVRAHGYGVTMGHLTNWMDVIGAQVDEARRNRGEAPRVIQYDPYGGEAPFQQDPGPAVMGGGMSCSTLRSIVSGLAAATSLTCIFGPTPPCIAIAATYAGAYSGQVLAGCGW
jgi:hypothetical protein